MYLELYCRKFMKFSSQSVTKLTSNYIKTIFQRSRSIVQIILLIIRIYSSSKAFHKIFSWQSNIICIYFNIFYCRFYTQNMDFHPTSQYIEIAKLGQGAFGQVIQVKRKNSLSQTTFAMKKINQVKLKKCKKLHQPFIEKDILSTLSSIPNSLSVHLYQTLADEQNIYFIMENCQGGSLDKLIQIELFELDQNIVKKMIVDIAAILLLAIQQIHMLGIIHRDLKPSNILFTSDGQLRVADFGTAWAPQTFFSKENYNSIKSIKEQLRIENQSKLRKQSSQQQEDETSTRATSQSIRFRQATFVGTPFYMAPQLIKDDYAGYQSDIWAYGCILHQMITKKPPFQQKDQGLVWNKIISEKFDPALLASQSIIKIPLAQDLIAECLQKNKQKRIGCRGSKHNEIKKHPFFSQIDWQKIGKKPLQNFSLIAEIRKKNFDLQRSMSFKKKSKILLSGIVKKKMYFGNMKERCLVLTSKPSLKYYEVDDGECKGQINLSKTTPVTLDGKYFSVTNEKKTYFFKSSDSSKWVEMIKSAIVQAYF